MAIIENHVHVTLNDLESHVSSFLLKDYIRECEDDFDSQVIELAEKVRINPSIRAVFISGPTASGKTTFTHKLQSLLNKNKIPTEIISLDDYYLVSKFKTDAYGRPDFESLETLDVELMVNQIKALFKGETVKIPCFDFSVKMRVAENAREITLPEHGVLLVEGLHGLSNTVLSSLSKSQFIGTFIMPFATLSDDYKLLDKRDVRILRRITRDVLHRGASALATIDYWPMLDVAESIYFPEYLSNADVYINSIMPYEFLCIAPMAHEMISTALTQYHNGTNIDSNFTEHIGFAQIELAISESQRLLKATAKIPKINLNQVPASSILNEFIK